MSEHLVGFQSHDHSACIADGVAQAIAYCEANGLRFTIARRRTYEILLTRHRAMRAYDILDVLREEGVGSQPPVVYRALDFLVEHGFAHRIERLNAFVACAQPGERHAPAFLICRVCDLVAEAQASGIGTGRLHNAAREAAFEIEKTVVEAVGLCPKCRENG